MVSVKDVSPVKTGVQCFHNFFAKPPAMLVDGDLKILDSGWSLPRT